MQPKFAAMLTATLLATGTVAAPGAQAADDGYVEYTGTATARHAPTPLYGEHHVLAYRGGHLSERMVLYTCPDGSPFARKKVTYVDSQAPDFLFEDASNGMLEGIRSRDGGRYVFFRANRIDPEMSAPLPQVADLVADAGFDEFIRAHWGMLMNGAAVPLRFLVPSRLKALSFDVQHVRSDQVDGKPAEVFSLKLAGVLGWVIPGLDVTYDAGERVLVRFEGISDLRDTRGDNLQASISFPMKDRRPSSAQAFASAEQAKIAPCR
jgi:hypothetical protein